MTTTRMSSRVAPAVIAGMLTLCTLPATALTLPPERMNYQGVLRDQNGNPLTGTYDMVFRFMDAETAGNEILVDSHTTADSNAVVVAGGLFDVALGTGTVSDGSGPGTYTLLSGVFKDNTNVWLEIQVGAETLSPRTQIHSAPYALNASNLGGLPASGFIDTSSTPQSKVGGRLEVIVSDPGVQAVRGVSQSGTGGFFHGSLTGVYGVGDRGGNFVGDIGVFGDGGETGVFGIGEVYGGRFYHETSPYVSAILATTSPGAYGIYARGATAGGYFEESDAGGANAALASNDIGIIATGPQLAGHFTNDTAGVDAKLALNDVGIQAGGPSYGSYLYNGSPNFSYAYIPNVDRGITAWGSVVGGDFHNFSSGAWAYVGYSTYKILGSGSVSFAQNHPQDPSKVIVYAAPEGDEVAVYTRGSGRLVDGEARVALGGTFALVTNPDIGLTATATPRGEAIPLGVKQVSPTELVVQGPAGSEAQFDYMVWGLRIGFEEQSIVQPKQEEAKIPSMHVHTQYFEDDPSLREHTALARFEGIEASVRGKKQLDFTHAEQLRAAIGVAAKGEPTPPADAPGPRRDVPAASQGPSAEGKPVPTEQDVVGTREMDRERGENTAVSTGSVAAEADDAGASRAVAHGVDLFLAAERIEPGDVVSLAVDSPGHVVRSAGPSDALLIGCAQPVETDPGTVGVASSRIALCRVDASYGPVSIGDRLTASPVSGTAMRIDADTAGAQVLGRAIEPLEAGTGLVRVLLGVK